MWALTSHQYQFVETTAMSEDRVAMKWQVSGRDLPEYVKTLENREESNRKQEHDTDSTSQFCPEVVIAGSAPESLVREHISQETIVFRYSERPLKEGNDVRKYVPRFVRWHRRNPPGKPVYLLCAGAYVCDDYARFHLFKNRAYRWGYFPETRRYADFSDLIHRKNRTKILWVGRFIDWKHPEDAVWVAQKLHEKHISFTMELIGTGPLKEKLVKMVQDGGLEQQVIITDALTPSEIRSRMEDAGIYLFTSDRREGWGAVLNESMNSGCAVVASHEIGSVPYLIKDGKNGRIYRSGERTHLLTNVIELLARTDIQESLGEAAYQTITGEWNAEVAAMRFIHLSDEILRGNKYPDLYKTGPCSRAERIREDWYQG